MEQERSFHFRGEPRIRVLSRAFPFDFQLVVHAFHPGQTRHRILGNALWYSSDTVPVKVTVPFLNLFNIIVLEVGLEHIRLFG